MSSTASPTDLVENEAYFRQHNERVQRNFEEIATLAKDSNQEYLIHEDDSALHFFCECSDEDCRQRIKLKPSTYNRIHQNRRQFIIISGHQTGKVERVTAVRKDYSVVEKVATPPETGLSLNPTDVSNT